MSWSCEDNYMKTNNNNNKKHIINIMVHHFCFCLLVFSNAFCSALHFHMASLCAKQQKAQHSGKKNCHHQQLLHCGRFVVLSWLLSEWILYCQSVSVLSAVVCICWRFLPSHDTSFWLRRYPDKVLWTWNKKN